MPVVDASRVGMIFTAVVWPIISFWHCDLMELAFVAVVVNVLFSVLVFA